MNEDIILQNFYEELEKISFDIMGSIKRVGQQLTTAAKAKKQDLIKSVGGKPTSAYKMDPSSKFVKQQKLQGENVGKMELKSLDDLAENQLVQTNRQGVQGVVDKRQIQQKMDDILAQSNSPEGRQKALDSLKKEFDLDDTAIDTLRAKMEQGKSVTKQDIIQELDDINLYQVKEGIPDVQRIDLAQIEQRVSKSANPVFNDAREEALAKAKMELGIGDTVTVGTKDDITQFVTLNPKAEAALDTSEMLTYAGINALGFAGRNAEAIAKGTALTGGAIGLYNILD